MPLKKPYIQHYCHIRKNAISLDGVRTFQSPAADFPKFAKEAYKHLGLQYPKFFKMDSLAKLSFLAAELIFKQLGIAGQAQNWKTALVFANKASSLDTDRKHQASIGTTDYFPSPAVFVYTLPNIGMGEISIRHKLQSENSFFIFDTFNAALLLDYSNALLNDKKADSVLCGWLDYDEGSHEGFMYFVGNNGNIPHNEKEITRLYQG